ncbi:hypothetical protein GJ496_006849 [Pomphorhynchus laevis]|nr:hypothetical protein GJ496_006849 [Pomphorhynchus laevis]
MQNNKVNSTLKLYDQFVRKQYFDPLKSIFDITNQSGTWLSSEDKQFYKSQVESKGKLGYCSSSEGSIHPSKLIRKSENKIAEIASELSTDDAGSEGISDDDFVFNEVKKRKYESTDQVKALTTRCSLSSRKASNVCVTLAKCGLCIATPTQIAFYTANIRHAKRIKRALIDNLHTNSAHLHLY